MVYTVKMRFNQQIFKQVRKNYLYTLSTYYTKKALKMFGSINPKKEPYGY